MVQSGFNRWWVSQLICFLIVGVGACFSVAAQESKRTAELAFVGVWDRAVPLIERASREIKVGVVFPTVEDILKKNNLKGIKVLFVLNLVPTQVTLLKARLGVLRRAFPELKIVPLDHRETQTPLEHAGILTLDTKVSPYWRANGLVNMRRLLSYVSITYLGGGGEIEPPAVIPDFGYYYPGSEDALDFDGLRIRASWQKNAPVVALLIQQSFWITRDIKVIDAEIHAMEKKGFNVASIFGDTGARVRDMIRAVKPDIIVEDRHGSMWEGEGDQSLLEAFDVPYLRPISMLAYTVDEWLADPRGLSYRDRGLFMTVQESKGTIEPLVVGGLKESVLGFRLHEPIPERIDRFASRVASWVNLRRKPNADKKVAIIYYNKSLGKGDLMRGSPTGAFLDAPESLIRFLPRLKAAGYTVDPLPKNAAELIGWIQKRGRNIGPWAQGELETLADRPDAVLIPASRYDAWFRTKLTNEQRAEMVRRFGKPPGRLMVVTRNERPYIVLPAIRLGNIILVPQPERGEKQDENLLHSRDVPPPHNYLAFYWWLQDEFGADALIHWGTHGTLELLPGKEAGLSKDDWSDICVGTMPVINPWIMDNLGEATLSRRRSYALLVDHLVPPAVNSGLTDELRLIHDDIDKFDMLEPGLLRESFRKKIAEGAQGARIQETLGFTGQDDRPMTDREIADVAKYLHEVYNNTTPMSLHILGQAPDERRMVPYLVSILRRSFLDRLADVMPVPSAEDRFEGDRYKWLRSQAEILVQETVIGGLAPPEALQKDMSFAREMRTRLRAVDGEIENLLHALNGGYVAPGPGPDPIRNPSSVPSGRNLYALNPEEIPARASWDVAVQLVDEMLRTKRPKKVGIDLNGMNTMRDFGVNEAQILYLMGVRPVWDENGLATDVALIPRKELGRPRVDVFVAMGGQYKENFPTRVRLLDKAIRLVSQVQEKDNLVRAGTERIKQRLLALGFSVGRAQTLASARIFGTKPGNLMGTNILDLVPRSHIWESDDQITSVYIDSMNYVYTGDIWGVKVKGLYPEAIQGVDTIVRVWASNMTSQLSNHHAYEYLGGLSLAVTKLTGHEPGALIADVRDPDGARLRSFDEVLATSLRTELLNRKWIEGMKEHGYAGSGQMAELVKNVFGWDVTRSSSVTDGVWNDIYKTYVDDRYKLGLRQWFERVNPHALQEIVATMMEASRKTYWRPNAEVVVALAHLYADLVSKHGPSAGLISGGNTKLDKYVTEHLTAPSDANLAENFLRAIDTSNGTPEKSSKVRGPRLDEVKPAQSSVTSPLSDWYPMLIFGIVIFLIGGIWRRAGVPS